MTKTESLLKELVELKKTELRRAKAYRILTFIFVTLPFIALIAVSIAATVIAISAVEDISENFPEMMDSFSSEQKDDIINLIIEEIQSKSSHQD